ncbi:MAG: DUF1772 domain-containing protein [Chloroflexi bacterium]|nr:DUF1772 domain-containing protein [Chloroflexota bacterium]
MTFLIQLLRFVNLFTAGIIAGGQVMVSMVTLPVMRRWSPGMSLQAHQGMLDKQPDSVMVPAAIICPLSALAVLVLRRDFGSRSSQFYLAGIAATMVVTVASVAFAEPTSVKMRDWPSDNVPAEYPQVRDSWDRIHSVRMVASLVALGAFIVGVLSAEGKES